MINKKNRGTHGDSSFMLSILVLSSEKPPLLKRWEYVTIETVKEYPYNYQECCKGAEIREELAIRGSTVNNARDILENWI